MVFAIILAGGAGTRMNSATTKQRMQLLGKTVIYRTVEAFDSCVDIDRIIVVCREDELEYMKKELSFAKKLCKIVIGGKTRAESSYNGLSAIDADCDLVAIHDAARCLIRPENISLVVKKAESTGAATAATAVSDTVKTVDSEGRIKETLKRCELLAVQTPQVFDYKRLFSLFAKTDLHDTDITDDNILFERAGYEIAAVDVGSENIKITTPRDLLLAELILKERDDAEL